MKLKAYAKVNPHLKITGVREDGYHLLDISYLAIDLHDSLTLSKVKGKGITVASSAPIKVEENLCYRAARALKEASRSPKGVHIELRKNIPIGAGLGGGSSDAAATLVGLNQLWETDLPRRELVHLGKELGADVPFFLFGGYCKGGGTGVQIEPARNRFHGRTLLIVDPPFSLSTPQVYRNYDDLKKEGKVFDGGKNDLQKAALKLKPKLKDYLHLLERNSAIEGEMISGSGSALFGFVKKSWKKGKRELRATLSYGLEKEGLRGEIFTAKPVECGQEIVHSKHK